MFGSWKIEVTNWSWVKPCQRIVITLKNAVCTCAYASNIMPGNVTIFPRKSWWQSQNVMGIPWVILAGLAEPRGKEAQTLLIKSTLFNFYSFFFFDKSILKPQHAKNTAEKCWNERKIFLEPNHGVGKVKELCKCYFPVPFSLHIGFCLFEGWFSGHARHTKNFYSRWD